jgi:hypothetical protein
MLFKSAILVLIALLTLKVFAIAPSTTPITDVEYSTAVLNTTLYVMQDCYFVKNKKDVELSKCMSEVFHKKIPNPQHYHINITGDTPGNLNLLLYNQAGYTVNCSITLQEKITVNSCLSYDILPLNNDQEMSITPPFKLKN